jgi:hypothetical protein
MIVVLLATGRRKLSTIGIAATSFVVMLAPLAAWFFFNRHTYSVTYGSWAIQAAHIRNPVDGLTVVASWNAIGTVASAYSSLIDPSYLLFSSAERRAPLHWLVVPLVVVGIFRAIKKPRTMAVMVLAGALVAPLAGASFRQPQYIANALALLPFVALLAGFGVDQIRELIVPPPPPPPEEEY